MRNIPKYFFVEHSDEALVFSAIGSINLLMEQEVNDECALLIEQLSQHSASNLVIDLGAIDHFGSIMLELMVVLWKHIKAEQGKFAVCNVPEIGQQVLSTTKLDTLWTVFPTREEALEFMRS